MAVLALPELSNEPQKHHGSCTFLSTHIVELLSSMVPPKPLITLSVGSGICLLEALIMRKHASRILECVEVESLRGERKYVADERIHYVQGTWATSEHAQRAATWLFAFPRDPLLLKKYVDAYGDGQVRSILWLGPREDWPLFRDAIQHEKFNSQCEFGQGLLRPNEMGWLWSHSHESIQQHGECGTSSCPFDPSEQSATEHELSDI